MKKKFNKALSFAVACLLTVGLSSCGSETLEENDDANAADVVAQFVDHTVAPTYTTLAAKAELLADELQILKQTPTDAGIKDACATFLQAREAWEMSEAFLFGAAGDFGVDPHIDSWPLDETQFNTLMNNSAMLALLDGEDGDAVAGESLGNALLGFHGLEYILFKDGQPKSASQISENEWIYVAAVAGELRNRCYQLEVGWMGDKAPKSHIEKLDDLEMQYTVAGGNYSYGENIKNAGNAGSTYTSRTAALIAIVQGCADIADEVGTSKINSAYSGEDVTYIESPYSHMSITDFHNNIVSIQNVYYGGVEGQRNDSKSLHNYVKEINSSADAKLAAAITSALTAIDAMPKPFVNNITAPENGAAVEACDALSAALDEVIDVINNK